MIFMGDWHCVAPGTTLAILAIFHLAYDFHGTLTSSRTHFSDIGQFPQLSWDFYGISALTRTWIHFNKILANLCYFLIILMGYLETSILAILAKFCDILMYFVENCHRLHLDPFRRHWPVSTTFLWFSEEVDIDSHLDPFWWFQPISSTFQWFSRDLSVDP